MVLTVRGLAGGKKSTVGASKLRAMRAGELGWEWAAVWEAGG
jgi:hypothetical protein